MSLYFIIGITVLCVGIGIQFLVVARYKRERKNVKKLYGQYFDFDISSPEHCAASFMQHFYPEFDMTDKNVLWALSGDYRPCMVVYDKAQMLVCDVELKNGEIYQRGNHIVMLHYVPTCINAIWLLRQSETKPVHEVDILYMENGIKKELKIIRFGWDIDGNMNYHKFRNFVNALKMYSHDNDLYIRNLIRPS